MRCLRVCDKSRRAALQNPLALSTHLHADLANMRACTDWHATCVSSSLSRVAAQDLLRDSFY
jgi:hypothetical protein